MTLVCILLYFMNAEAFLAYRRVEIADGEYWRVVTGNLLHTNAWHLAMNLAGLWVILLLHHMHYRLLQLSVLFLIFCLLQGVSLYLFVPSLLGYVGLSGMLHGLFTYGAIKDILLGYKTGYLLLTGVILKVIYEQVFGAGQQITDMINARVATEAHLIGVISAIVLFIVVFLVKRIIKQVK
nr:rhombosortase [Shewanella sp. UCD-KL12]